MNKADLVKSVASKTGLTKTDAENAVKAFTETIIETMAKGENVQIAGFGTFTVAERAARTGRNPATGEEMQIAASRVPKLKFGKAVKEALN